MAVVSNHCRLLFTQGEENETEENHIHNAESCSGHTAGF
jgi:hypothetical protein